jgi:glycosyltransferase involved in cell wall biosynthesis
MSMAAQALAVPLYRLGFCNQTEMPSAYAAADVLVLPSDNETWGLVANEALACGRPVVLSEAVGAAPDLAADGTAGRVFAFGDVPRLAEALGEMFTKPPSLTAIAKKSADYSLEAAAKGVVEALSSVCIQQHTASS